MPVTVTQLQTAQIEAKALFLRGLQSMANPMYQRIAQQVTMTTKTMETPIAGMIGPLEEWVGARTIESLWEDAYSITAKKFQKTVGVPRESFEDNTHGTYIAQLETFGQQVAAWPDQQVAAKLQAGETDLCYDGLSFFNTAHLIKHGDTPAGTFSNLSATGGNPAWYLFDLSKGIKPLIWALRSAPEFVQKWSTDDDNVFWKDEYISGVRARGVADFGLPHFCYKSKTALDATNYETAVEAMMAITGVKGENMGVYPTLLVVPTVLKGDAQRLFERQLISGGENNIYYKDIEWAVWQRLSNANQA